MIQTGDFIQFHLMNTYRGVVLGIVDWDDQKMAVIRYYYDQDGDPMRKPYTLIELDACKPWTPTPEYVLQDF